MGHIVEWSAARKQKRQLLACFTTRSTIEWAESCCFVWHEITNLVIEWDICDVLNRSQPPLSASEPRSNLCVSTSHAKIYYLWMNNQEHITEFSGTSERQYGRKDREFVWRRVCGVHPNDDVVWRCLWRADSYLPTIWANHQKESQSISEETR